jgi:hypothetical protein
MVQGLDKLRHQLDLIPRRIQDAVKASLEASANSIVSQMNAAKPHPSIVIAWSWNNEQGSGLGVKTYTNRKTGQQGEYGMIALKIRATGPRLNARIPFDLAKAYEFGTNLRQQVSTKRETGAMPSRPYFFPTYRANKRGIRARARAAVVRAVKELNRR